MPSGLLAGRSIACDEIIEGWTFGPGEKADAYNHRGEARAEAGALGQTIADFTASIRIRPDNVPAFAGRGYPRNDRSDRIPLFSTHLSMRFEFALWRIRTCKTSASALQLGSARWHNRQFPLSPSMND
jgi:hypothetical protein